MLRQPLLKRVETQTLKNKKEVQTPTNTTNIIRTTDKKQTNKQKEGTCVTFYIREREVLTLQEETTFQTTVHITLREYTVNEKRGNDESPIRETETRNS